MARFDALEHTGHAPTACPACAGCGRGDPRRRAARHAVWPRCTPRRRRSPTTPRSPGRSPTRSSRPAVRCGSAPASSTSARPATRLVQVAGDARRCGSTTSWSRRDCRPTGCRRWSTASAARRSCRSGGSTSASPPPSGTWCAAWSIRCPDPRYPFLGVHFTRRVSGELEVGPNAVLATAARGLPPPRRLGAPTCATCWRGRASGGWPARHWRTGDRRGASARRPSGRSCARPRATCPTSASPTCPRRQRRTGAGGRPGRQPGRRLPDHPRRRRHLRAQRALARRHLQPGDRGARGRRGLAAPRVSRTV